MTTLDTWVKGARPRTLAAALAPVIVATALAGSEAMASRAALALLVSLSLQIGVNYSNDYSDGIRGTDSDRVGPIRIVASGLATPNSVKTAAIISFLVGAIAGLVLAILTSWWLIAVGATAILAAWYYTGGKKPYGYSGLGEIAVFLFFGLVATMGSYFVQTEEITLKSFLTAIPVGALACAILAINNIRDREKDQAAGKRTVAVRLGDQGSRNFFVGLLLLAHLSSLLITPWALLTLILAPLTFQLAHSVKSQIHGSALIPSLARTGELQLLFAGLLALALWLA
ncbi:MAG TPA: 1,4-dihydroxy-2-naphthoate polyprenyltransferase [Candidatus Paceibacterota bacterium]|nr:1,4-dihydroxy-2-naphthoate polyprenyltransferase [Candidatus Paceibacterota bacterium]